MHRNAPQERIHWAINTEFLDFVDSFNGLTVKIGMNSLTTLRSVAGLKLGVAFPQIFIAYSCETIRWMLFGGARVFLYYRGARTLRFAGRRKSSIFVCFVRHAFY